GKSTHASHPSQGINSLEDAAKLIHKLTEFDLFSSAKMGRGHFCVLNIEGGHQAFTVPSYCKIFVNRQLTLGEDEKQVTRELKMIIKRMKLRSKVTVKKRYSPDPLLEYKPYLFEKGELLDRFIGMLPKPRRGKRCVFTTSSVGDFNIFAVRTGVPTLVFGPGGGNIHSPNEFVYRSEVITTADYLLEYLMEVLG
ncbi:MAG: M20/M25/M40 family metallo-hydrolase, partial [Candidatus Thermoplasmatota archaeon]|nr:M20/M25/M40 family metallo-hydrolase [Candidatus Thermoplasmatota archaeon]